MKSLPPSNPFIFLTISESFFRLQLWVKPNAKKSAILGIQNNALAISLHAKPMEGEANKALIDFLSDYLDLPKSQVVLEKGGKSRMKQVKLPADLKILEKFSAESALKSK